ncbi:hypothetical protein WN943_015575 [Citrus x changshan-huyou]
MRSAFGMASFTSSHSMTVSIRADPFYYSSINCRIGDVSFKFRREKLIVLENEIECSFDFSLNFLNFLERCIFLFFFRFNCCCCIKLNHRFTGFKEASPNDDPTLGLEPMPSRLLRAWAHQWACSPVARLV